MDARQGEVRYKNFEPQELASKTVPLVALWVGPLGHNLHEEVPTHGTILPVSIILLGNECSAQSFGDWITL